MIARSVENAVAQYLIRQSVPGFGGQFALRTDQGAGIALEVRTGHDERGEFASDGVIICRCLDEACQRLEIGVNAYRVIATVELRYPADRYTLDRKNVAAFDWVVREMEMMLVDGDAFLANLTAEATGIAAMAYAEPDGVIHHIDGNTRQAIWALPIIVSRTAYVPELQTVLS